MVFACVEVKKVILMVSSNFSVTIIGGKVTIFYLILIDVVPLHLSLIFWIY